MRIAVPPLVALSFLACGSDLKRNTRAFVASTSCGQGPYEIHLRADGKTGADGVEIIACTPRRIAGHVVFTAGSLELANRAFGDASDNQRCLAGDRTITATTHAGTAPAGGTSGPAGTRSAAAPALVERPFTGSETPFADELCGRLGLTAQQVLMPTILLRTSKVDSFLPAGADLHVRLWSDTPNDLEGVVFMIRHLTSKKTPQQVAKEEAERDRERNHAAARDTATRPRPRVANHGPPPAPLVEERPPRPVATATWIPGYWTWTGSVWGWVAGFWRDERIALPAPRIEIPGAAPRHDSIWIGGTWTLRAGQHVWIGGRWRSR